MSNTIQLKDKVSGEIITLKLKDIQKQPTQAQVAPKKDTYAEGVAIRRTAAQEQIAKRGNLWGGIKENFQSPNTIRQAAGALGVVGAPLAQLESGIANPALQIQAGNFNPVDLAKEAFLGFTGRKQGQYGDIMNIAGAPKPVSAATGVLASWSPIQAARTANKVFGAVRKMSDKGILKAGDSLIAATKEATKVTGEALEAAYKGVNNTPVNQKVFTSILERLPKPLQAEVQTVIGEKMWVQPTVENVRKIKQVLGKYKPSAFGKEQRGLAENIEGEKLNQLYSEIKNVIDTVVETKVGKKTAQMLSKSDEAFSKVSSASDYIQKTVTDPTLKAATKAGAMATKLAIEGDVSGRTALNILKQSGARREINKAIKSLEAFNKWQMIGQFGQHAANAALFGGAVGSLGGLVAGKLYNRDQGD
jgi:hypothetical protein